MTELDPKEAKWKGWIWLDRGTAKISASSFSRSTYNPHRHWETSEVVRIHLEGWLSWKCCAGRSADCESFASVGANVQSNISQAASLTSTARRRVAGNEQSERERKSERARARARAKVGTGESTQREERLEEIVWVSLYDLCCNLSLPKRASANTFQAYKKCAISPFHFLDSVISILLPTTACFIFPPVRPF